MIELQEGSGPYSTRSRNDSISNILPPDYVKIINSEAEGECKVKSIECLYFSYGKLILFIFLSIITVGIWSLFVKWFLSLRKASLYSECKFSEATHFLVTGTDGIKTIEDRQEIIMEDGKVFTFFWYQLMKYVYYPEQKSFKSLEFFDFDYLSMSDLSKLYPSVITDDIAVNRISIYGKCMLEIPVPGLFSYLSSELIGPFYILQYFSVVLWIIEKTYIYSGVLLGITLILTIVNYCFVRSSALKIKEIAFNEIPIKILRKSNKPNDKIPKNMSEDCDSPIILETTSSMIVPGDIIVIDEGVNASPCDCVLISGEVLMNESMLNGESTPVPKFPIINKQEVLSFKEGKRHILFEGTKVLEFKPSHKKYVLAICLRTGYTSLKGQLVRTVIFPKSTKDTFSRQVLRFIIIYAFVQLIFFIPMFIKMLSFPLPTELYVYRVLDIILWAIPPSLPIYLSFCITIALMRLKKKDVLGLQPQKIISAGQVSTVCFDKTGTLTKNEIEVYGFLKNENKMLGHLVLSEDVKNEEKQKDFIFKLFSTCHGVYKINNKLQGDSLDIEMLKFSEWQLINSTEPEIKFISRFSNDKNNQLEVRKVFEFASEHQRLSVITNDKSDDKVYVFSKGAPEKIISMCIPETVCVNFHEVLEKMAMRGYRILGLGYKEINKSTLEKDNLEQYERYQAESDLNFLGFLILENKLKDDTAECIAKLKDADILIKIISGDNPLTTIQASREANIITKNSMVYLCDINYKDSLSPPDITYKLIQPTNKEKVNNDEILKIKSSKGDKIDTNIEFLLNIIQGHNEDEFAMTGPFFEYCSNVVNNPKNYKNEFKQELKDLFDLLIKKGKIFSRMKPEQKASVIEEIQKRGFRVGMVGDGANDCSALKQADIGISFTEADASFCAPFSSLTTSIICVERVLLEGRATLLNNVEVFRYVMSIAFFKYISAVILTYTLTYLSDFQFIYMNFMGTIPTLILIGFSGPSEVLSRRNIPDNLAGVINIVSIYGQLVIGGIGLLVTYSVLKSESFYQTYIPQLVDNYYKTVSTENTSLFLVINILFIFSIVSFVFSSPFKLRIWRNYPMFTWIIINIIYNTLIIFLPSISLGGMNLTPIPDYFKLKIFLISYGFGLLMIIYEDLFVKILIAGKWDKYQKEKSILKLM